MPQTRVSGSPAFKFDLAAPPNWDFAPGDTIIGNLVRHIPIVTPEAVVSISLVGRAKSKIVKSNGQSRQVYRDDWRLLNTRSTVIFKGPLHLAEGSDEPLSWDFAVPIPTTQSESCRAGHKSNTSFISLNRDHPNLHILPGTFSSAHRGFGHTTNCFVEYFLKAQLRYTSNGGSKSLEAVLPIQLRHTVQPTNRRHMLRTVTHLQKVQSQRLLPGMESAELSFKQHAQKFFHSSKVPEFYYELRFTVPEVIQLNDPVPIPIQLEAVPLLDRTSVSLKDAPQKIRVDWIQMTVKEHTHVSAPLTLWNRAYHNDYSESRNLSLQAAFNSLESPLDIDTGKGNEPIHIGNMFQLVLRPNGLVSGERYLAHTSRISPDFITYNINHTHGQKWKVSLTVAGENHVHEFSNPLRIIATP